MPIENSSLLNVLANARRKLLDTGTRNRLVHVNRANTRSNSLNIVNEQSDEVYRILKTGGRRMRFKAMGKDRVSSEENDGLHLAEYVPDDAVDDDRLRDDVLETPLGPEGLARRLLRMAKDARTAEEEQGLNILFLALGFLRWKESPSSEIYREAPLILLPVEFVRNERTSSYDLRVRDDEISTNLPLKERLRQDFGILLPEIEETEEWLPSGYFDSVQEAVSGQLAWSVDRDGMQLGFFSFAKLLMHHDLDLENWPGDAFEKHKLLNGLLLNGFEHEEPTFPDGAKLDKLLSPADIIQVVDADASQTKVIEEVRRGADLVVQGPPGTGKSQTITNILAAAAHDGKTVLFVAEKMAALSVVHNRLVNCGLRDICLELHSRTANKKAVVQELGRTLSKAGHGGARVSSPNRLHEVRDELNALADLLHSPVNTFGDTAFGALAEIIHFMNAGVRPPSIPLQGLEKLGSVDRERGRQALGKLAQAQLEAGAPGRHPFNGVRALQLQPTDLARLEAEVKTVAVAIENLLSDSSKIANAVGTIAPTKISDIEKLATGLTTLLDAPVNMPRDIEVLFDLAEDPRLQEALNTGSLWQTAYQAAEQTFSAAAWTAECSSIRRSLVAGKASIWQRWFGSYRRASAELSSLLSSPLPQQPEERIQLVDILIDVQQKRALLASEEAWLSAKLKEHWRGEKTDFREVSSLCEWLAAIQKAGAFQEASQLTRALSVLGDPVDIGARLQSQVSSVRPSLATICARLQLDLRLVGFEEEIDVLELSSFSSHLLRIANDIPAYSSWVGLCRAIENASVAGAKAVVDKLLQGQLTPTEATNEYMFACAEARWTEARRRYPAIEKLRDLDRHALVDEFAQLERDRISDCRKLVRLEHSNRVPRGTIGEMGIIRGEVGRKKGHKPIRWLMKNAGSMVQRIKPIMLMSPISVAQYLPAGVVEFDLLVIDEASQVRPEDSFGCIARAKQVVVVGDQKQLPPTSFFDRMVDDAETDVDEDEGTPAYAADMESILTLCEARGIKRRMLSWHYRSRDPSLIRVSNAEFYEDELILPPSPLQLDDNYGLKLKRVAGVYAPKNSGLGRAGTNRIEAEEIATAVAQHARSCPQLSLGVVAFSKAQSDMITEVIENRRRADGTLDRFLLAGGAEDFFVKNIENVQGDERDVIMISVGYGPQVAGGRLTSMAFGPINGEGGGRRLNVLFSRARTRCEVFISFDPADIDPSRSSRDGLRVLKRFLDFAKTGIMDEKAATGLGADSPFEEDVAAVIRSLGYEADPQVGSSGFRIDIGVRHPERPAQYILAVECDGAAYHSALWARERDRLRQEVLEGLGWRFHRIWSTDWFHDRQREVQRLRETLAKAREALDASAKFEAPGAQVESPDDFSVEAGGGIQEISLDHLVLAGTPYRKAEPIANFNGEPHEAPIGYLAKLVTQIIEIEGPIHAEEVARRIAAAFGKSRTGNRIQEVANKAINYALRQGSDLRRQEQFLFTLQQQDDIPIRDRSNVEGALLKAEYLPPMEITTAAELIVKESGEMSREDLTRAVANLLGYQRLGPELARAIGQALEDAELGSEL
ncbi:DUF3320 domain-containing protein [Rhizobium sp. NRK18]|uniref:DUF3320 domain-containing protein n=1 Tax=Rhizobium sp. NRK18 TaxID=2964667 RepID=UPI0021C388D1|nr:DUF3320 domain-containing protein [Rhizobium sp. NRK18]MCQ2005253.1 DUF3320 domain-containing protein [Rhizobium sp. NRK18]